MAINTIYLDGGVLKSAKKIYDSQYLKSIRLEEFFQPAVFNLLQRKLENAKWQEKFDPEKYLFETTKINEIETFINGDYMKRLARDILGKSKYKINFEIRKFSPGNYTLLHDSEKEKPGIDFIIDFSKSKDSFGGHITYLTESEELLILNPMPNTLTFVERKKGLMKFTKYVQHRQKNPIFYVVGTIT